MDFRTIESQGENIGYFDGVKNIFECWKCHEKFYSERGLRVHFGRMHRGKEQKENSWGPPDPKKLAMEIVKKYSVDEFVRIAMRLLSHDMVKEPPALIEKYGEAMYEKGHVEGAGLSGYDYDEERAWVMVRDKYFKKVVDDV